MNRPPVREYRAVCVVLVVLSAAADAQDVLITEFQAKNNATVSDKDGGYPDRIELYNAGVAAVNLSSWFQTDEPADLRRWCFPAVVLEPRAFLVVFPSGKYRRDPGAELHSNFRLVLIDNFRRAEGVL